MWENMGFGLFVSVSGDDVLRRQSWQSEFLSDYASIKNGSYSRLMKAYYGTGQSLSTGTGTSDRKRGSNILDKILEEKMHPKVSKEVQKANTNLTAGLSSLNASVATLQNDSTYTDSTDGRSAADKVVSAVKAYVTNYNNVVTAAKDSTLSSKTAYVANMMSSTAANADKLSEIGVTVNSNGTLDLDVAKLKEAGASKVLEMASAPGAGMVRGLYGLCQGDCGGH